jgi:undecaprenyl diphosphate synthase
MTQVTDFKNQINLNKLPNHIAIIMDGNGRWAKAKWGRNRLFGHANGVRSVREVTEAAAELGVSYLTLYAFSSENWGRPQEEVSGLMNLLVKTIRSETKTLMDNNIKLNAIGDLTNLPSLCYKELQESIEMTKNNSRMTLTLALSYGSRWEMVQAIKNMANELVNGSLKPEQIDEKLINSYLHTRNIPDPELLIRTSGEFRISNFLLWQIAYSELYFTPVFWPDFDRQEFYKAILDFQNRERRFGMISEQLTT